MTSSFKWKNRLSKIVRWGVPTLCTTVAVLITVTIGWRPVFREVSPSQPPPV